MVVFRVRGVPIRIGWSWLAIVALVFWSLAAVLFPSAYPGRPTGEYVAMAAVGTLLLFASLLVHELCHTLQSMREGVHVKDITLFLFGGVSQADEPVPTFGAEFRIVAAGPLASFVLMLFFGLLALVGDVAGLAAPWVGVLGYLARINGLLLVFNLVPALPLDGGRLLHSWLWRRSGDREKATIRAAGAGRGFAIMLITLGVAVMLVGDTIGGVWFVAIGWFLLQAVRAEVMSAKATQAFTGLRVLDLMTAPPVCLRPDATVAELAAHLDELGHHPAYPVLADGRYLGTLVLARAGAVPEHRRGEVRVGDLLVPADALPVLHPEDEVVDAARRVSTALATPGAAHRDEAPTSWVVLGGPSGEEPVGVLSTTDLERVIATADLRGRAGARVEHG